VGKKIVPIAFGHITVFRNGTVIFIIILIVHYLGASPRGIERINILNFYSRLNGFGQARLNRFGHARLPTRQASVRTFKSRLSS
jgi:hypothetical protein